MSMHQPEIEIVRIGKAEYAEFASLLEWRRTGSEGADASRYRAPELHAFFEEFAVLESPAFHIYAARVSGKLVGYINAVLMPKPDPRRGILYVDELWTAPPYRGQGIAGRLLTQAENLARELRLWRVRLYVNTDNDAARACYRRAGFTEKDNCLFCEMDVQSSR